MKIKILPVLLLFIFLLQSFNPSFANNAVCVLDEMTEVVQGTSLTISGNIQGAIYYVNITIKSPTNDVVFYDWTDVSEQGDFSRRVLIPKTWPVGEYTVIAGDGQCTATQKLVIIKNPLEEIMDSINQMTSVDELIPLLEETSPSRRAFEIININLAYYDNLSEAAKSYVRDAIFSIKDQLNSAKLEESCDILYSKYNEVIPYAVINYAADISEIQYGLDVFGKDFFGLDFSDEEREKFFSQYLFHNLTVSSVEDMKDKAQMSNIFYDLNHVDFVNMTKLFKTNYNKIGLSDNSFYEFYKGLSTKNCEEVNKLVVLALFQKPVYKTDDFVKIFENAVDNIKAKLNNDSSKGGASGGGGRGSTKTVVKTDEVIIPTPVIPDLTDLLPKAHHFTDIDETPWAKEAISALAEQNIISKAEKFRPSDFILREEFVKILMATLKISPDETQSSFEDVGQGEWYTPYIATGEKLGLINGLDERTFCVGKYITRQEMAVLIFRCIKHLGISLDGVHEVIEFEDSDLFADYAVEAIKEMQKFGIITGKDNYRFDPLGNCTRAETAVVAYRLLKNMTEIVIKN